MDQWCNEATAAAPLQGRFGAQWQNLLRNSSSNVFDASRECYDVLSEQRSTCAQSSATQVAVVRHCRWYLW
jgi:hypothetical protein